MTALFPSPALRRASLGALVTYVTEADTEADSAEASQVPLEGSLRAASDTIFLYALMTSVFADGTFELEREAY